MANICILLSHHVFALHYAHIVWCDGSFRPACIRGPRNMGDRTDTKCSRGFRSINQGRLLNGSTSTEIGSLSQVSYVWQEQHSIPLQKESHKFALFQPALLHNPCEVFTSDHLAPTRQKCLRKIDVRAPVLVSASASMMSLGNTPSPVVSILVIEQSRH